MKRFWYIWIVALVLASCELMVEVDVPDAPPMLVVTSLFSPDSVWNINVSATAHVLSEIPPTLSYVPVVQLKDETGLIIPLTQSEQNNGPFGPPGWQQSRGWTFRATSKPLPGKSYTVEASAYRHESVIATAAAPSTVDILDARLDSSNMVEDEYQNIRIPVEITFSDPAGTRDYYIPQLIVTYEYQIEDQFGNKTRVRNELELYLFVPTTDFLELEERSNMIDDKAFDGKMYTIRRFVNVHPFMFGPFGDSRVLGVRAVLNHCSEDYFKYFRSVQLQQSTEGNPFAQPTQVYSNVQGGLGIFTGYSASKWEFME